MYRLKFGEGSEEFAFIFFCLDALDELLNLRSTFVDRVLPLNLLKRLEKARIV
jgi:hypothetical protein